MLFLKPSHTLYTNFKTLQHCTQVISLTHFWFVMIWSPRKQMKTKQKRLLTLWLAPELGSLSFSPALEICSRAQQEDVILCNWICWLKLTLLLLLSERWDWLLMSPPVKKYQYYQNTNYWLYLPLQLVKCQCFLDT